MEKPRVVITGIGVIAPIGIGVENYWEAALSGASGSTLIDHFDPGGLPSQMAAVVRQERELERLRGWTGADAGESRVALFALAAAQMATEASDWNSHYRGDRLGIFLGTSGGRVDLRKMAEIAYRSRGHSAELSRSPGNGRAIAPAGYVKEYCRSLDGKSVLRLFPQYVTALVAGSLGVLGTSSTIQTACTSSAQAIGEALRAIQRGAVDAAVAGGAECIVCPIEVQLFCLLGALSRRNDQPERASRPFDAERDGFVLGEGAGFLVLERLERALARSAPILAELAGYGTSCDAYRVTDEAPDGRGAILAMKRALEDAGLSPEKIDYVNAHGTSTPMNDRVETLAIKAVFGQHAYQTPVSSTKSMIGHTISAAGAIELITCVLALRDQMIPPTINYEYPDPECDLDYVPNRARTGKLETVLSNSFGFGGHNDCLVVKRFNR
ncbi:MAG: beta-ketoacyl-[acyl-carrier-protein] synthase family protein [Deltaproteobacteria bacterium]|nr:beta-ketoacyl-[acyl-carrier-protein] synthase family protein [Deltaproteobacteria bacterium]